jgi:hypothetical protein
MTYNPNTTSTDIVNGTIVDIDINSSAAIFSSKISPNYITINGNPVALGGSITVSSGGATLGYYGEWQSDQNQPYGGTTVVNQSYAMFAEVNDGSNGIRMVSNDGSNSDQSKTRLTFDYAGTYNIQWSGQFENTDNSDQDVNVWLRKNGTDIFGSNGIISVPARHGSTYGHTIPSWNFILTVAAGDYIEFIWSASNAGVYLLYSAGVTRSPSSNSVPSTASVIITAQLVAYVQSAAETTGISSGSVISGTAIGTSNKAVDYSAISNGLQISGTSPNQTVTVKPKTSGGITVDGTGVSLTSNTISGVALGGTLANLSIGTTGLKTTSGTSPYTGTSAVAIDIDNTKVPTISGGNTLAFTTSGATSLIVPTSGTLATLGSNTFTANQNLNSNKLTSVTDPTAAQDAATKNYVDRFNNNRTSSFFCSGRTPEFFYWSTITPSPGFTYYSKFTPFQNITLTGTSTVTLYNTVSSNSTYNGVVRIYDSSGNYIVASDFVTTVSTGTITMSGGAGLKTAIFNLTSGKTASLSAGAVYWIGYYTPSGAGGTAPTFYASSYPGGQQWMGTGLALSATDFYAASASAGATPASIIGASSALGPLIMITP